VLELTVRAEPRQLAPVRHRIAALLDAHERSAAHIWRVTIVATELLSLSISQGNARSATLRLVAMPDATRIELVDDLEQLAAFDSDQGRIVTQVATIYGVIRDPSGTRTVWCDIEREE
jgi:hypothetical protein